MPDPDTRLPGSSTTVISDLPWRTIALFVVTAVGVVVSVLFTRVLLFAVVGAVALAVVTQPITLALQRRMSAAISAALLVVAVTLALLVPIFFIVRDLVGEAVSLVQYIQQGQAAALLNKVVTDHPKLGHLVQHAAQQADLNGMLRKVASSAAGPIALVFSKVADGVTTAVMLLFFYFFLVRDHQAAKSALAGLIPLPAADTDDLLRHTGDVVQAIFAGRFLIAIIQGAAAGLAYLLLGVPGALLWSAITVVCCLIPSFGSFIAWIPVALYLGLAQSWTKALILALWGAIVVGNLDNVLYPVMVGRKTDMHTAVIFLAIFGGLAVFGLSGFVLGPVIVAATLFLLRVWKRRVAQPVPADS